MRQAAMHMKRVHWLYASAASITLHAAVFLALKNNILSDGGLPPGPVAAIEGSVAGIIGSAIEIEQSAAPRQPEVSEEAELPEPLEAFEPAKVATMTAAVSTEIGEAVAETSVAAQVPVATPADMPVLHQVKAGEAELVAMAAPVSKSVDTSELPQVEAKAVEPEENKNAPPPAASPRRDEKRKIRRERQKAEQRKKREVSEADGEKKTTSRASRRGNSANEGNAGTRRGGGGKSGASSGALNSYAARVRSRILSRRPSSSVRGGKTVVSFGLSASGSLRYARISRSSGNASLDQKALATVRGASPFPAPPKGARASQLRFSIFFQF